MTLINLEGLLNMDNTSEELERNGER